MKSIAAHIPKMLITSVISHPLMMLAVVCAVRVGMAEPVSEDGTPTGVARKLERSLMAKTSKGKKIGKTHSGYLERHRFRDIPVILEEQRCYTFVAAAGPGSQDISLTLHVGDKEVASDRISGNRPTMRWCAATSGTAVVRVSMYDGEGTYVMLVLGEKTGQAGLKKKVGGEGEDFTANRIRQLHAQFAKDKTAYSPVLRGNLASGESTTHTVTLKGGHCYSVLGAGSLAVRDLNIAMRDAQGKTAAEDRTQNSFPVIDSGLCPTATQAFTLHIKMASGTGLYGVQLFSD